MEKRRITVVGATSGVGKALLLELTAAGWTVLGIGTNPDRIARTNSLLQGTDSQVIAADVRSETGFLSETDILVHCSSPALASNLLAEHLERIVLLGSTRKYTRFPDERARDVIRMEQHVFESGIPATVLHPTLIYGGEGADNIERILRLGSLTPVIPLPAGGDALVQPIHVHDVVAAVKASLLNESTIGQSIVLAGPTPMSYRAFVTMTLKSIGQQRRIINVPYFLLAALAPLSRWIRPLPTVTRDELRRLLEDKHFDIHEMQQVLGVIPRDYETGLSTYLDQRELELKTDRS